MISDLEIKISKTTNVLLQIAAVVGAITILAGGYTFYLNYVWKPKIEVLEVDFNEATAKLKFGKKTLEFYLDGKFISTDYSMLIWGNIIAFVVAIIAIKSFIGFLNKYGFKIFGIYRIGVGIITLILIALSKMDNL